ncbi:hypothetical protein M3638_02805 [Oceanobacillus profundus]|uniref:hypothetical protein n=1 Tax=Oceanobacillus profundus TaxID=372463 RepID=UPI00203DC97D|nr:hypothetical protein [Oceanobacillus profundus]MCM3396768.1 hypothetical protein [Oceanobacillus profundus]
MNLIGGTFGGELGPNKKYTWVDVTRERLIDLSLPYYILVDISSAVTFYNLIKIFIRYVTKLTSVQYILFY